MAKIEERWMSFLQNVLTIVSTSPTTSVQEEFNPPDWQERFIGLLGKEPPLTPEPAMFDGETLHT